jgi:SAM-dependent MidA family methyltransferase
MERLDVFMARANAAFYATVDPYREFTTSPEISQVFGELLGAWAAVMWQAMGAPDPVVLAELGPGRGTLMADALRAARLVPGFAAALRVHFVETSPRLRERQKAAVPQATWHDDAAALPGGPLLLLANEFVDALPIRQFVRTPNGWAERHVRDGAFVTSPADPADDLPPGDDEVTEICEPARALATLLGARVAASGGAALFLDYGPAESAAGDSLQALRGGAPADPLSKPGSADLTAHVDFAAMARAARAAGAAVHGPAPQGMFLARLGLFQRTDRLARGQPPARAAALIGAAQRLAEPDRMGRLFKALAICHPALPLPPGFET